jgi:hypothetical protein
VRWSRRKPDATGPRLRPAPDDCVYGAGVDRRRVWQGGQPRRTTTRAGKDPPANANGRKGVGAGRKAHERQRAEEHALEVKASNAKQARVRSRGIIAEPTPGSNCRVAYLAAGLLRHKPTNAGASPRRDSIRLGCRPGGGFSACRRCLRWNQPPAHSNRPVTKSPMGGRHILTAAREKRSCENPGTARTGQLKFQLEHDQAVQAATFQPGRHGVVATAVRMTARPGTGGRWRTGSKAMAAPHPHKGVRCICLHVQPRWPDVDRHGERQQNDSSVGRRLRKGSSLFARRVPPPEPGSRAIQLFSRRDGQTFRFRSRKWRRFVWVGCRDGGRQVVEGNPLCSGGRRHAAFAPDGERHCTCSWRKYAPPFFYWPSGQCV